MEYRSLIACAATTLLACGGAALRPGVHIASHPNQAAARRGPSETTLKHDDAAAELAETGAEPTTEPPTELSAQLPTGCAGDPCMPPVEFVEQLCRDRYPGVALIMMEKHAPWSRGYVRQPEVSAVNTLGGPSSPEKLVFGEEVVILKKNGGEGSSMQVSGMGGYFALRWDGTCVTLAEHEIVTYVPGLIKTATIEWKYLDDGMKDALLGNAGVTRAREAHRKECQGTSAAGATGACATATRSLNTAIVLALRHGIELPTPTKLPAWAP